MSERTKVELDAETRRIVDFACEKLGKTPEEVIEEAIRYFAKLYGYDI